MDKSDLSDDVRDKCASIIMPHLEPIMKFVHLLFTRYGIEIPIEFWLSITLTLFSLGVLITGISVVTPISFGLLSLIIILFYNQKMIQGKIAELRIPTADVFLNEIDKKTTLDVQRFLRDYRRLGFKQLTRIFESRHVDYPSIQLSIVKYQIITGELIEFLVNMNIENKIRGELLRKYIIKTRDDISNQTYNTLICKHISDKRIVKPLMVAFPAHLTATNHPIFEFFALFRVRIRDWFNYGAGDSVFFLFACLIVFASLLVNGDSSQLWHLSKEESVITAVALGINYIIAFFITACIFFIIFKLIIKAVLSTYKHLLILIAPFPLYDASVEPLQRTSDHDNTSNAERPEE